MWDGRTSKTVENAWQYSKVYKQHLNKWGRPKDPEWYEWSENGFSLRSAVRYPMGKGVKPEGLWWNGRILSYLQARKQVYWRIYRDAVSDTPAFSTLCDYLEDTLKLGEQNHITLWDFDGYDRGDQSLWQVMGNPNKKMGHAFVLAAMLIYGKGVEANDLKPLKRNNFE